MNPTAPVADRPLTPEEQADALLETVDLDPLGRALANLLWSAWEREQRDSAAEAAR